jgi:hypothetical protein
MAQFFPSMIDPLFLFQSDKDEPWAIITLLLPLKIKGCKPKEFQGYSLLRKEGY